MEGEKLEVDLGELRYAYEDFDLEHSYFPDLQTGEVIFISHFTGQDEEMMEKVERGLEERYISLPRTTSHEGYRDMKEFIETVEDENLVEKLCIAIDGRGAFRRFKNVLKRHPDKRERWFEFKKARSTKRVKDWLNAENIQVESIGSEP